MGWVCSLEKAFLGCALCHNITQWRKPLSIFHIQILVCNPQKLRQGLLWALLPWKSELHNELKPKRGWSTRTSHQQERDAQGLPALHKRAAHCQMLRGPYFPSPGSVPGAWGDSMSSEWSPKGEGRTGAGILWATVPAPHKELVGGHRGKALGPGGWEGGKLFSVWGSLLLNFTVLR